MCRRAEMLLCDDDGGGSDGINLLAKGLVPVCNFLIILSFGFICEASPLSPGWGGRTRTASTTSLHHRHPHFSRTFDIVLHI
jgi:hypothetical protein